MMQGMMSEEHKAAMQEMMAMMGEMRSMMDDMETKMQEMMGGEDADKMRREKYLAKPSEEREKIDKKNVMHKDMGEEDA